MKLSFIACFLFFAFQLLYSQKIDDIIVDFVKIKLYKTLYIIKCIIRLYQI